MPIFHKISLRPEVENYLKQSFLNKEVVSASSKQEAERKFEALLIRLAHPPSFTTVRVNTHLASVEYVRDLLLEELQKQFRGLRVPVLQHPTLPDVLLIPVTGPRRNIERRQCEVIVGAQCGNAVLRGAHVYVPGIVSASKFMKAGDVISVYSDIKGKCKKGAKEFDGTKVFLGNGISELSRKDIFNGIPDLKGIGIRMTEPIYLSPSFDNVLPSYLFLQGEVIALDKVLNKVEKLKQNASLLGLHSIRAFCFDATKALKLGVIDGTEGTPPFLPESFDRILLDAPCSGMGQRPNMACTWTLKEVTSYQPLQRKLLNVAVRLLKPGGVLVYSTCTVTLAENEEQVAWALTTFPCLQLQPQEPQIGGEGMMGAGLAPEQLKLLQRFDPSVVPLQDMDTDCLSDAKKEDMIWLANKDCIGFFIAKFIKYKSTEEKVSWK
ncbi:tRNA (cytosine(72)-C(5))-methyltransferase NSUN6 isoform X3 [Cricetulus griseus]|uniref:tRNA (Cytosine(72)-C(5))-methyltransferase NSUN6 isoform X3 n=1 Tax=Cricetulus griseus TaxID=10029 RepID=A0A9J7FJH3_CRIGR|nr:tRNA (cytosine(72)-C(5))-methyltransferase NSUN6 isoform X3 [Cricetulus griseus]XP_035312373.1 tRNA (cytosine(72)-C(5))-methyltransferase NSUN6 isoform X3 [Cricetulus griseus]